MARKRPVQRASPADALQVRGTAQQIIAEIPDGKTAAAFLVAKQQEYDAVREVWGHVRSLILLEGKGQPPFQVETPNGVQLVSVEPDGWIYDLTTIRELAPEAVKWVEATSSEAQRRIHELAGKALEEAMRLMQGDENSMDQDGRLAAVGVYLEEIVRLSQPTTVEAVDGRVLPGIASRRQVGGEFTMSAVKDSYPRAYRKKPVVVEAARYDGGDAGPLLAWCPAAKVNVESAGSKRIRPFLEIATLEGVMRADHGDWIIKGVKGEFYPCKNDIFEATYDHA